MPVQVSAITPAQRDKVVRIDEGHFADVKSIEVTPAKLTKTISGFANADGGELYVGVDETGPEKQRGWRGFADQEAANGHLQIFEKLFPLGRDFQYTFLECDGNEGIVLQVQVFKTRDIMVASDGKAYVRRGAQSLPVTTAEDRRRLEYAKGLASFETELVNANPDVITNSETAIGFMLEVVPTAEPEAWLRKQQLVRENRPTVAGVLLFADEPQALLPKRCGIKIYRYKTVEPVGFRDALAFDPLTVEGPLYTQIGAAVATTIRTVEQVPRLGEGALEAVKYPQEAIHEILTNAVLHRDYSVADDVHVRIFDNRIEVESPGRLPGHVTVRNILDERFARNGNLVRLLNKYPNPPNKDVGEGLNTAFEAMTNLGLKEPVIHERENSVLVIIRHEPLASPEAAVLEYLETHATIKNSEARKVCHISADYAMKIIFNRLTAERLIEKVPGTRTAGTAYRKVKKKKQ
jgi:ATP-dependent DNA helicase RecG